MKYFTPERYLRLGNLEDKQAFLAAQQDWEQAVTKYATQLRRIQEQLPAGLRRLVDSVYLHDARVLGMWLGRVSRFTISLQPESDPSRLVVLTYSLLEPPGVNKRALPPESCSEPVAWLYDELDIQSATKKRLRVFVHSILLSNGWEIRLRFRDVTVTRPMSFIPGDPGESDLQAIVSRSA
jgi:hypothetical protein